jgi:putative ABC transport system ATP-binding protein
MLVTHEPEVAQYAKRIIEVRDGRIKRDVPVADRHDAEADLRELEETEPDEDPSELVAEEAA